MTAGTCARQTLAMIQLSPEEAEQYRGFPVVLDFSTGFYVLPVSGLSFISCNTFLVTSLYLGPFRTILRIHFTITGAVDSGTLPLVG